MQQVAPGVFILSRTTKRPFLWRPFDWLMLACFTILFGLILWGLI